MPKRMWAEAKSRLSIREQCVAKRAASAWNRIDIGTDKVIRGLFVVLSPPYTIARALDALQQAEEKRYV
ncbi:hypothetical protein [Neptunomonas sp. XY-337]|uniref:hypothetical protein n=1 Tax=Neptunomonas sp. XY-337 TaxID=2561897 RepID=UPI0010AB292F|nr:hypothetical protein [Neptunomonas sp. XY-337]